MFSSVYLPVTFRVPLSRDDRGAQDTRHSPGHTLDLFSSSIPRCTYRPDYKPSPVTLAESLKRLSLSCFCSSVKWV